MLSVLPLPSAHIVLAHIYPGVYSGPILHCIYHAGSHIQVGEVVYKYFFKSFFFESVNMILQSDMHK